MRLGRRTASVLINSVALGVLLGSAIAADALIAGTRAPRATAAPQQAPNRFPHQRHANVFPLCTTCHAGVVDSSQSLWPDPVACAACHDGVVKPTVQWSPRVGPRPGNRRFTHAAHDLAARTRNPADSTLIRTCSNCHVPDGSQRMNVRPAVIGKCLTCHGLPDDHFNLPPDACAKCHVRLTDAPTLTRDAIARFPKPRSHESPDFLLGGHGKLARTGGTGRQAIASSCATCHSRNLCLSCHVNAPDSPVISALALDDRAPQYRGSQPIPDSHRTPDFLRTHGRDARKGTLNCAACHARESCATCHVGVPPREVSALAPAGDGRAAGVHLIRKPPLTHTNDFRSKHGPLAASRPATCETCHERSMCLECHRPSGSRQSTYHPAGFLSRHPSSAYAREASCADCHNPAQFCQSCHQKAGLAAIARIGRRGYHDAFRGFSLGHGQAARQSLESCASCHAERDCTACHSAVGGGFRFNPHGPGFNAARARAKNPSMCIACHGRTIPTGP